MRFLRFLEPVIVLWSVVFFGLVLYTVNRPIKYDFNNGAYLVVPWGTTSFDQREDGFGIAVEAGRNVTAHNNSSEWRTLTVSYRRPGERILSNHAFEDLPPKTKKVFGADPAFWEGMHVSISDYAQEKRGKD